MDVDLKTPTIVSIVFGIFVMLIITVTCSLGISRVRNLKDKTIAQIENREKEIENVREHSDEYDFFYNGEDIDYDKIDIEQYNISIDQENKKVFLTDN